jgi:hypothetical protein
MLPGRKASWPGLYLWLSVTANGVTRCGGCRVHLLITPVCLEYSTCSEIVCQPEVLCNCSLSGYLCVFCLCSPAQSRVVFFLAPLLSDLWESAAEHPCDSLSFKSQSPHVSFHLLPKQPAAPPLVSLNSFSGLWCVPWGQGASVVPKSGPGWSQRSRMGWLAHTRAKWSSPVCPSSSHSSTW